MNQIQTALANYQATFTSYPDVAEDRYQDRRVLWHAERGRAGTALSDAIGGIGTVVSAMLRGGKRVIGVLASGMQIWHGEIICQHKRSSDDLGGDWTLVQPTHASDVCDVLGVEVVTDTKTLAEWAHHRAIVVAAGGRSGGHSGRLDVK